jgi:putative membrane protein
VQKVSEQIGPGEIQGRGLSSRQAAVLAVLACVLAYSLVIVTFLDALPYPPMGSATVEALAHVIAVINSLAIAAILRGWWLVRRGRFKAHRRMMTTAFGLILLFLLIYLFKVGGGGIREFSGSDAIKHFSIFPCCLHT